jgi:hypothetical protein
MKPLKILCECPAKDICGHIKINDFSDNTCTIDFFEGRECLGGVWIQEKQIKKLIKYLEDVCQK